MAEKVLDEELEVGLRQAKKKPRNFAIVAKGPQVLKLIVQRKPIKASDVIAAKSEFKGNLVIEGVCEGDGGQGMVFKVVGDEPTIKAITFKEFISEQTGLTIKPRFEIVTQLEEVDDDDSDEVASAETESSQEALAELIAKMNKLAPAIKAAAQTHPSRKEAFQRLVSEFQGQHKAQNLEGAKAALLATGRLLKDLLTTETPLVSPTHSGPSVQSTSTPANAWEASLARWQAARNQVVASLQKLGEAIQKANDPEAVQAIILVKGVQAQLTARPDTRQKVAEIQRYLETDHIVAEAELPNGFDIVVRIRDPLLSVLGELSRHAPA